jgi:hypothetical protein
VASLVTAFVLAVVGAIGAVVGAGIVDWLTDDYRITVEDSPEQLSTATGPRGGAYIVPVPIEDGGDPPISRTRASGALTGRASSAGSTPTPRFCG